MAQTVLGLITARGGSKGLPRKNIRPLAGKPLVAWTIEAALNCPALSRVVVSTDDAEIAEVCRKWGADIPFIRPGELAQDDSPHMDVIIHAIKWLKDNENWCSDYVMLLQPTSPFCNAQDIDMAVALAKKRKADSVVSVTEAPSHPYFIRRITEEGTLVDFAKKPEGYLPRQLLPPAFFENGAIYLARREVLIEKRTFYTDRTYAYVMPPERSLNIDTPWDLYLADLILKDRNKNRYI